ncbi:Arc family DNA-binding protein [Kineosporia sp. A_224]|uniref:FitA-like ribbon-helix-helix domain-containing protein n=1 Tax=Kineosporia sp. A_224 TaxID=1962180 RepID=UPI000B4AFB05|nr:Arc family DNA-binding protein [Kineosporia sp. A_224]
MATVSIRDLDDGVRDRLRVRAARNGRSMEAEMREILTAAVTETDGEPEYDNPFTMLIDVFHDLGGVHLEIPPRTDMPRPVDFGR